MKRVFFSVLLLVAFVASQCSTASAQDDGKWGHLTGQIVIEGTAPANPPEDVAGNKDKDVCLVDGKVPADDGMVVNDESQIRDVYVMMYAAKRAKNVPTKFHPSYEASKAKKVVIDNHKCRFVPKASFARPGQTLVLKNSDAVGHNCRINTMNHGHNVNIVKNSEAEVVLETGASDTVPGEVKCDMHTWMDAIILVRDNPYVAISDETGKFTIENIPAGEWEFQFWHKKGRYLGSAKIKGYEVTRRGVIDAAIADGETLDLGTITVPAAQFESKR